MEKRKFKSIYKLKIKKNDKEGGKRLKNKINFRPLFSIITVVLNQEKYLEQTIKSILSLFRTNSFF